MVTQRAPLKKKVDKPKKVETKNSTVIAKLGEVEFKDKLKSSYYLDIETEERIATLYMKRLREGQRPRKSQLVDEAIKLLYETEMGKK